MLFSDQRQHKLVIPAHDKDSKPVTIAYLIDHLCRHVMKDSRKELFVLDDHMYVLLFHRSPLSPGFSAAMSLVGCPASLYVLFLFSLLFSPLYPQGILDASTPPPSNKQEREKSSRRTNAQAFSGSSPSSRPGILVLINDADWELEGEESYELQGGDNILFVSTLHGG